MYSKWFTYIHVFIGMYWLLGEWKDEEKTTCVREYLTFNATCFNFWLNTKEKKERIKFYPSVSLVC